MLFAKVEKWLPNCLELRVRSQMKVQRFDLFLILIAATVIAGMLRQIVGPWDWDMNHMMYFGQRLLSGEFHWTQEFDDKLPVLQIIFAIPAAFDSILVWFAIALAMIFAGAVAVGFIINDILYQNTKIVSIDRARFAVLGGAVTSYLAVFFPGRIHHINSPAASLAVIALALLIFSVQMPRRKKMSIILFVVSAFAASVAIGIRPYFAVASIVGAVWVHLRAINGREELLPAFRRTLTWVGLVAAFGLLVNFFPYVVMGETEVFFAGMAMLGQALNPKSTSEILYSIYRALATAEVLAQVIVFVYLIFIVYALTKANGLRKDGSSEKGARRKLYLDVVAFSAVIPAMLLTSILGRHFWPHYLQMFSPFIGMGFALFFALRYNKAAKLKTGVSRLRGAFTLTLAVALALASIGYQVKVYLSSPTEPTLDQIAGAVEEIVSEQEDNRSDFLFLGGHGSMYTHWKLSEPRHGFPHAANTSHIVYRGWWDGIEMPAHFGHPTNAKDYCADIEVLGPSIVIVGDLLHEFSEFCLNQSVAYRHFRSLPEENITVFVRD